MDWEWASTAASARIFMKRNCQSERRVWSARNVSACAVHLCRPARWCTAIKWPPVPSETTTDSVYPPTASKVLTNGTTRLIWLLVWASPTGSSSSKPARARRRSSSAVTRLGSTTAAAGRLLPQRLNHQFVAQRSLNWAIPVSGRFSANKRPRIHWRPLFKLGPLAKDRHPTTKCRSWAPKSLCRSSRINSRSLWFDRERPFLPTRKSPYPVPK